MPLGYQLSYFMTAALVLGFVAIIFFRRPQVRLVQAFAAFMLSIASWIITLYFYYSFVDAYAVLVIGRLNFVFSELIIYFGFLFSYLFPQKTVVLPKWVQVSSFVFTGGLVALTMFTGLIDTNELVKGIERVTVFGPLYPLFVLHFLVFAVAYVVLLVIKYKKSNPQSRRQIVVFALGWGTTLLVAGTTNIFLPLLTGNYDLQNLGPTATLFLTLAMAYVVARQELLEVKLLAAEGFVITLLLVFTTNVAVAVSPVQFLFGFVTLGLCVFLSFFLMRTLRSEARHLVELNELTHRLEQSNATLRELDELKTMMVSIASHQMRGPLGGIRGYLTMFKEGDLGPLTPKQKDIVSLNLNVLSRLLNAVETFLDITKIQSGKMLLMPDVVDLDEIVMEITREFEVPMATRGLAFTYACTGPKPLWVKVDPEKLKHVVFNLIDNAHKYTEKGSVSVGLTSDGQEAVISVTDTGMGIAPEDVPRLFGKFERGSLVVDSGGSGLGLYVVKMLTEMHGGRVWATSPGPKRGATFYVSLPLVAKP